MLETCDCVTVINLACDNTELPFQDWEDYVDADLLIHAQCMKEPHLQHKELGTTLLLEAHTRMEKRKSAKREISRRKKLTD